MYLNREQEKTLAGEYGWARAKALEIIVRVGEALGADKLLEIVHAHVSGISYINIREPGLRLLEELAEKGGRAAVYTTVNPGCVDLAEESQVIDNTVIRQQMLVNKALEKMGFKPTYTCIPYLNRPPAPGERLSWGESNAVAMANSFYGAYTNREGGPLALASALTGYTYNAGLQVLENRTARIEVHIPWRPREHEYSLIGLWIGRNIDVVPKLVFDVLPSYSGLKLLFASAAATGSHGLVVVEGVTPHGTYREEIVEKITLEGRDLGDTQYPEADGEVLGYIGCPHLHPSEVIRLAEIVSKYSGVRDGHALLVSIPLAYSDYLQHEIMVLKNRGVDVTFGTCPIVSRLTRRYDLVLTNSGKALFYLEKLHGLRVSLASMTEIVEMVMER